MKKNIENNLLSVSNCLFKNRSDYQYLTNKHKIDNFFIIRRYLSKLEPELFLKINNKNIDPILGMDLIFYYFKDKKYPHYMWSKSKIIKEKEKIPKDDLLLLNKLDVDQHELFLLKKFFPKELESELKYYKLLEKEYKNK